MFSVRHFFSVSDDDVNVQQDNEIQSFRQELLLPRKTNGTGGCGMNVCIVNFKQYTYTSFYGQNIKKIRDFVRFLKIEFLSRTLCQFQPNLVQKILST